ncbi:MAG: hypothetical protein RBQ94_00890 [Methanimicrococcus sp.]|nr:hypothetical protein [Methanimicrococcus sp.]
MVGCFYFISNEFYDKFPNSGLMLNKDGKPGDLHDRPCFFAFPDKQNPSLFWLIPISSQILKYHQIYDKKFEKYNYCNTIYFCKFIGEERAFLIQNMFPVTQKYIADIYIDRNTQKEIRLNPFDEKKLIRYAKEVMKAHKIGKKVFFVDIESIKSFLLLENDSL